VRLGFWAQMLFSFGVVGFFSVMPINFPQLFA
jgi:hypothetical protein